MSRQQNPEPTDVALIFDPEGRLFLMRSHKWKGQYVIPGGHIELGETMEQALRREVKEETNLDITDIEFVCFQEFIYDDRFWQQRHFIFFDYAARTDTTDVKLNSEAQEYIWVDVERTLELPVEHYTAVVIGEYLRRRARQTHVTEIKQIDTSDGRLLRDVYLRMYADSPHAFSESLAEARALTAEQWDGRAERFAERPNAVAFVATVDDTAVGFVAGYVGRFHDGAMDWTAQDVATMAKAWVDPRHRRRGIGQTLAGAVKSWATTRNVRTLEVQVTEGNGPGIEFYKKLGFADTGRREPLRSNPSLQIRFLGLSL